MAQLQICTVASREYVPYARVLAAAIRRHHPGTELVVLLVEDLQHEIDDSAEPFRAIRNHELGIARDELHRMYLIHGNNFLAAVKPFFLEHLVKTTGAPVLYCDADISVYGSLAGIGELIEAYGVVLSPHVRAPIPLDGRMPDDTTILSAGTFNAGFLGVGTRGLGLLEFLKSRLARECVVDVVRMRVNEQRWLDYVPSMFDCHVLDDPGLNAAYWNLYERPLSTRSGKIYAGDAPLRAYHFSGYDPLVPQVLSRHAQERPRITLAEQPILAALCREYCAALEDAGLRAHRGIPAQLDHLPGGIVADPQLRAIYREAVLAAESSAGELPPDGHEPRERERFLAWAARAYADRGLPPPPWATSQVPQRVREGAGSIAAPSASPRTSGDRVGSDPDELVQRLARSTVAALGNLDQRLSALERHVADLAGSSAVH